MSTTVQSPVAPSMTTPQVSPYKLTFGRLVRSEWIKLASLRSTWFAAVITVILSVGISLIAANAFTAYAPDIIDGMELDMAFRVVLMPTMFTVLLAAILGAIQVTGEYSTGMIRSTLTAAPGRLGSLFAKVTVVGGFVFILSIVTFLIAAIATTPILGSRDWAMDFTDPTVSVLPILYGAITMTVVALIGLGAGYMLRSGPGAIALAVGIVFVLPLVPGMFAMAPGMQWIVDLGNHLPTNAGQTLMMGEGPIEPGIAAVTLAAWAVAALAGSAAVLRTRDA